MNNHFKVSFPWTQAVLRRIPHEERSQAEMKLEEIRQTSNVIQSLENVMIQSEDNLDCEELRKSIGDFLDFYRRRLLQFIHQP